MNFFNIFKLEAYRFISYGVFVIGCFLFYKLRISFAILFGATLFAIISSPIAKYLQSRHKLPKKLSIILSVSSLTMLVMLPLVLILPIFLKNVNYLLKLLKFNYPAIKTYLTKYSQILKIHGVSFDSWSEILNQMSSHTGNFANLIAEFTLGTLNFFWVIVILPVLTIVILANASVIWSFLLSITPKKIRPSFKHLADEMAENLRKCFFSEVKIAVALTVLYSCLLGIINVKNFLIFGLAFGAFSFLPYLGFFICSISLYISVFLAEQDVKSVVILFVVLTLGQIIDALFITSKIVGKELSINSGVVLIILVLFIPVFGFLGALLVIPCIAMFMPVIDRVKKFNQ